MRPQPTVAITGRCSVDDPSTTIVDTTTSGSKRTVTSESIRHVHLCKVDMWYTWCHKMIRWDRKTSWKPWMWTYGVKFTLAIDLQEARALFFNFRSLRTHIHPIIPRVRAETLWIAHTLHIRLQWHFTRVWHWFPKNIESQYVWRINCDD